MSESKSVYVFDNIDGQVLCSEIGDKACLVVHVGSEDEAYQFAVTFWLHHGEDVLPNLSNIQSVVATAKHSGVTHIANADGQGKTKMYTIKEFRRYY